MDGALASQLVGDFCNLAMCVVIKRIAPLTALLRLGDIWLLRLDVLRIGHGFRIGLHQRRFGGGAHNCLPYGALSS